MPKQKTHKGIRKRFKVTANGKVKHKKAFRGHKLGRKTSKRNRQATGGPGHRGQAGRDDHPRLGPGL